MTILGLHIIDALVIVLYFSVVLYIGFRSMKRIRSEEDYFLGGRQFGRFFQTFSQFGQATSSESAVQTVSIVGVNGLAGAIQGTINALFIYPVSWLFPKWLRRTRFMSMAEYFIERFECRKLAALYALAQTCLFLMVGGMGLYAMSKTVMAITEKPPEALSVEERAEYDLAMRLDSLEAQPLELLTDREIEEMNTLRQRSPNRHFSFLNHYALVIFIAVIVFLYAALGGLEAAVYTDSLQGVFILILTVMLVPFAMLKLNAMYGTHGLIGPFEAIHGILPESMFEIFGSPKWAEFTWYNILLIGLMWIAGNIAFSNNLVVAGAARTEKVASFGGLSGSLVKGAGALFWMVLALLILGVFGETNADPDLLWGMAARELLPLGLLGLMVACLMAAFMSSADMHMMTVSGLITQNIYKPLFPGRPTSHYVTMGRIFTLVYIVGAVLFAMNSSSIFRMWKYMIMINICCGPAMLMGFLWRRTNARAVWTSMGVSLAITLVIPLGVQMIPGIRYQEALHAEVSSPPVHKTYTASERDVAERVRQIEKWNLLQARGLSAGVSPQPLEVGQKFSRTYAPAPGAIYWDGGIKLDDEDRRYGAGLFKAELYLMHLAGINLTRFSPAGVEAVSLLFRLVFPFLAILVVGWSTRPQDARLLDFFYGKQRTPVEEDAEADRKAIEETRRHPHRFDHLKRFPESNWEITRIRLERHAHRHPCGIGSRIPGSADRRYRTMKLSPAIVSTALALLVAAFAISRADEPGAVADRRPNILIFFMDDLNASIGCMDMHPDTLTPNIDRLRQRGVLFSNAGSNYPVCGPSRASIWSGLYPHTTGYFGHGRPWGSWRSNPVLRDAVTVFEHFSANGYRIYAAGKIHHNGNEDYSIFRNRDGSNGFEVKALFGPYITNGKKRPGGNPMVVARAGIQKGGVDNADCDFGPFMTDPPVPGGTGSWVYEDGTPFHYRSDRDRDLVPDEKIARQAREWLGAHDGKDPFFMTLGILRPHSPLILPQAYFERFPLEDIHLFPGRKEGDDSDTGIVHVQGLRGGINWGRTKYYAIMKAGGPDMLRRWTQAYLAAVSFVDDRIGEVLDALEASPFADNTIVILSSDHGYHMGDKELLHKFTPWESAVRVPLIIAGPGVQAGGACNLPVSLVDIYPTLNALAGLDNHPNRAGNGLSLDGHSLVPLLRNPDAQAWAGPPVYLSVIQGKLPDQPGMKGEKDRQHYTLRSATHRYVRWNNGYEELYDHTNDPWEWNNVAGRPANRNLVNAFRKQLTELTGIPVDPGS